MYEMIDGIREFMYQWQFAPDGLWREINPQYQPLKASSQLGLIALLRISVPAIGHARPARVAEAIRQAGYRIVTLEDGCAMQRDTRPQQTAVAVNA